MKIRLRRDWDSQPKLGDRRGHHVTREGEHAALVDFLSRRDEGSMFVCGSRGVGKTSSVIAAVNEASGKQGDGRPVIPVLINATAVDFRAPSVEYAMGEEEKRPLLRSLIHFLDREVQGSRNLSGDLKKMSERLRKESLATEARDESVSERTRTRRTGLDARIPLAFLAALAATGLLTLATDMLADQVAAAVILCVSLVGIATVWFELRSARTESSLEYMAHLHDFTDLQTGFEDLLRECRDACKIVFILDEFDKISLGFDQTIIHMKMMFNQGDALFVFITSTEDYGRIRDRGTKEYTLFSQSLFLKRPLFAEMRSFINAIVDLKSTEADNLDYMRFRNYLCYESRCDFFALYNVIRDHTGKNSSDENLVINFSFNDTSLRKSVMQEVIEHVYGNSKHDKLSMQRDNDEMLERLYDAAGILESYPRPEEIAADDGKIKFAINGSTYETVDKRPILADLFIALEKNGYLKEASKGHYKVIGTLTKFDPSGIFGTEQRRFHTEISELTAMLVTSANIKSRWVMDKGEEFGFEYVEEEAAEAMK